MKDLGKSNKRDFKKLVKNINHHMPIEIKNADTEYFDTISVREKILFSSLLLMNNKSKLLAHWVQTILSNRNLLVTNEIAYETVLKVLSESELKFLPIFKFEDINNKEHYSGLIHVLYYLINVNDIELKEKATFINKLIMMSNKYDLKSQPINRIIINKLFV